LEAEIVKTSVRVAVVLAMTGQMARGVLAWWR
jgi:hypothetical protein